MRPVLVAEQTRNVFRSCSHCGRGSPHTIQYEYLSRNRSSQPTLHKLLTIDQLTSGALEHFMRWLLLLSESFFWLCFACLI